MQDLNSYIGRPKIQKRNRNTSSPRGSVVLVVVRLFYFGTSLLFYCEDSKLSLLYHRSSDMVALH
jgi:hypothetical protein